MRVTLITGPGFGFSLMPAMSNTLGSLLAGAFRGRLDVTGLPAGAADTTGESVVAAHLVAERAGSAQLAASANNAYVHGMGVVLVVCGLAALVSALPAAARPAKTSPAPDMAAEEADARQ